MTSVPTQYFRLVDVVVPIANNEEYCKLIEQYCMIVYDKNQ